MSLWSTQTTPTAIVTRINRCSNCQYVSALARKLIDIAFFHHYHPSIKLDDGEPYYSNWLSAWRWPVASLLTDSDSIHLRSKSRCHYVTSSIGNIRAPPPMQRVLFIFFSSSQINITHILSLACHVSVTMGGSALHMNSVPWIVPESSSYWLRHSPVDPSGISVCIVIVFDVRFQAQIVSEG